MIKLLEEIIEAGNANKLPLGMESWVDNDDNFCATSCCLCGDVAVARMRKTNGDAEINIDEASELAEEFYNESQTSSYEVFGNRYVATSIYAATSCVRHEFAVSSGVFTVEELEHPHLTTDHDDRTTAHDFVRLVIRKIKEYQE